MWINDYKESGWFKSLLKEAYYVIRFVFLFVKNGGRVQTVLFYPEFPLFKTELNSILRRSGYNITNNPKLKHDGVVAWEDTTFRPDYPLLHQLGSNEQIVNMGCDDISKRRVESIQQQIFGYSLGVDPRRHTGACVRKSNLNGRHNETEIVDCPIARKEPESIYQRLVNNSMGDGNVEDVRVHICGQKIVCVTIRHKPEKLRFYGDFHASVDEPSKWLSAEEIALVLRFASAMGLDYGEMDTLRDADDGRLYIVDVNNTPYSAPPSAGLSRKDRATALQLGRVAFVEAFLRQGVPLVENRES